MQHAQCQRSRRRGGIREAAHGHVASDDPLPGRLAEASGGDARSRPRRHARVVSRGMHYELRELHDGKVIDGVRYTAKGHTFCAHACKRGLPDGDTIAFTGSTPLPARKDMVLMAAYRASKAAAWPDEG